MLRNFFKGRYGVDQFGVALIIYSLVFGFASMFFPRVPSLCLAGVQLLLLVLFALRAISKNFSRRRSENEKYLRFHLKVKKFLRPVSAFFKNTFKKFKAFLNRVKDKDHKYFKCKRCGAMLRVPKGRGVITITCPKCGNKFDKKS